MLVFFSVFTACADRAAARQTAVRKVSRVEKKEKGEEEINEEGEEVEGDGDQNAAKGEETSGVEERGRE